MKKLTHLDLFSGIGGASIAVDEVFGKNNVTHIFCDNEPFAQAILKKHWPEAKIYGDIRTLTNTNRTGRGTSESEVKQDGTKDSEKRQHPQSQLSRQVDILTGGFPCQPFSQAGRRKGTDDDRYLWPEMLRVIREFKPRWVIGENVGGFVTWSDGLVLRQVFADLESEGYEVQAFVIPAVAVNAPHRRDRVWIVANSKIGDARQSGFSGPGREGKIASQDGFGLRNEPSGSNKDASDAERKGWTGSSDKNKGRLGLSDRYGSNQGRNWRENWVEVATKFCRMDDGLPAELDGLKLSKSRHRAERLKGLGNAWVPAVAIEIMKKIKEIDL
jgi:DNA (cytosine-5)-methyltransferase 1